MNILKNKKTVYTVVFSIIILFIIYKYVPWSNIGIFICNYKSYLKEDVGNQISLFESIIGGICTGITTFGALFITILHENKKNRETWEKEKEKERELRLWSILPVLNLKTGSMSAVRNGRIKEETDMFQIGNGDKYVYVKMSISNTGNGNCRNLNLERGVCSVRQLSKGEEISVNMYFYGLDDDEGKIDFEMIFNFQDDLGNAYLQLFNCHMNVNNKNIEISKKKPCKGDERV